MSDVGEVIDTRATTLQADIGIDGKWNMILVKTPDGEDLDGKFADEILLLPFHGPEPVKQDSIKSKELKPAKRLN